MEMKRNVLMGNITISKMFEYFIGLSAKGFNLSIPDSNLLQKEQDPD